MLTNSALPMIGTAEYWAEAEQPLFVRQILFEQRCRAMQTAAARSATSQMSFLRSMQYMQYMQSAGWPVRSQY